MQSVSNEVEEVQVAHREDDVESAQSGRGAHAGQVSTTKGDSKWIQQRKRNQVQTRQCGDHRVPLKTSLMYFYNVFCVQCTDQAMQLSRGPTENMTVILFMPLYRPGSVVVMGSH